MTWTQTTRGRRLDLRNPQPGDVDLVEIAQSIGRQCRYAGGVSRFYSVAEHCWLMADRAGQLGAPLDLRLACLLHDAAEAYTGDITWPMQAVLWGDDEAGRVVRRRYKEAQRGLDALICALVDLPVDALHTPVVGEMDLRILLDEREALLGPPVEPWYPEVLGLRPLGVTIRGWAPEEAAAQWWARLASLQVARHTPGGA